MYRLDRDHVKEVFKTYTDAYDSSDPKIALKIEHTYHVAEVADQIAMSLNFSKEDQDLAWLLGMLHDIGRFEQVRRYGTFIDAKSIAHALMSCQVLFPEAYQVKEHFFDEMPNGRMGRVEDYLKGMTEEACPKDWPQLIHNAISLHSAFRLPKDQPERERLFSSILRDADKVDIFRVNIETPLTDIINCTEEEIRCSDTSPAVEEAMKEHHVVQRRADYIMTAADHIASHVCLAFELTFPKSREIAMEQGYLKQLLEFRNESRVTCDLMEKMEREVENYFAQHANDIIYF